MLGPWLHLGNWCRWLTILRNQYPCTNWCLNEAPLINPTRSYTRLSLCVCACAKCMLKLCMVMYNYALSLWAMEQKFDLKNNLLLKTFIGYPKRRKYFTTNKFHTKISKGKFFPNYSILFSFLYMYAITCSARQWAYWQCFAEPFGLHLSVISSRQHW